MHDPAQATYRSAWRRAIRVSLIVIVAPIALITAANVLTTTFDTSSNCGGNSAALFACSTLSRIPHIALQVQPQADLGFDSARRVLGSREFPSRPTFLSDAEILIRSPAESWPRPPQPKIVVAVCATPFSNVRIHSPWNVFASNTAHAVSYSDGSSKLLSPTEFRQLDLSGFVPIETWKPDW